MYNNIFFSYYLYFTVLYVYVYVYLNIILYNISFTNASLIFILSIT